MAAGMFFLSVFFSVFCGHMKPRNLIFVFVCSTQRERERERESRIKMGIDVSHWAVIACSAAFWSFIR